MSVQNIVNITEANLQQILEQSMAKPVLFYFWSERSQHCLQLTPVLESLAAQYNGQFILAKLDCDAEPMVASQFGLRAIPTVYLFQNGQPVDGFQGPQPEEAIRALLDKVLPREEELKAQEGMALMQEGKYDEALPLLKEAAPEELTPERCFQIQLLLIHFYRRVVLKDPLLPEELLPAHWAGQSARQLCINIYQRVAPGALAFVSEKGETSVGELPVPGTLYYQRFGGLTSA